jgi:hypothetical protein
MIVFGGGSASAAVAPVLYSPSSSAVEGGGLIHVKYAIPNTPDLNSGHLTFTTAANWNYQFGMYGPSTADDFTFSASNGSTSDRFYSGGGVPIPDGIYTVTLDYTVGGSPVSIVNTNVVIKNSTAPPTLISPADNSKLNFLSISYTLAETATTNTTKLKIYDAGGPLRCTLNLTDVAALTTRTFTLNPASLTTGSQVVSYTGACSALTDGSYDFQLSYVDAAGDPAASDTASNVTLDTVTQVPTLITPTTDSLNPTSVAIQYSLPEAPTAGTASLTFSGPSNSVVHLAESSAGTHGYSLDPKALFDAVNTLSVSGDATLADGLYSVSLSYNDVLGNPSASTATATNVRIGPLPEVPGAGGGGGGGTTPSAKKCFSPVKSVSKKGTLKKKKKYSVKLSGKVAADGQSVVISSKVKGRVKLTFKVDGAKVKATGGAITVTNNPSLVTVSFKVKGKTKTLKIQLAQSAC